MTEAKQVAGPGWFAAQDSAPSVGWVIYATDGSEYAKPGDLRVVADTLTKQDADHIVQCVNAHNDLFTALRDLLAAEGLPEGYANRKLLIDAARAAIAKASA